MYQQSTVCSHFSIINVGFSVPILKVYTILHVFLFLLRICFCCLEYHPGMTVRIGCQFTVQAWLGLILERYCIYRLNLLTFYLILMVLAFLSRNMACISIFHILCSFLIRVHTYFIRFISRILYRLAASELGSLLCMVFFILKELSIAILLENHIFVLYQRCIHSQHLSKIMLEFWFILSTFWIYCQSLFYFS